MKAITSNYNKHQLFTVQVKDYHLNDKGEIYPHILLEQLENSLIAPVKKIEDSRHISATRSSCVYKVEILGSAQLGDEINISIKLGKFDQNSAIFHLSSYKNFSEESDEHIICEASFSYKLESKENSPMMAS